jgi:BirA family biotin operon repressor/biotin-[acetyl-CoA-carboxylase] ligase
VYDWVKQWVAEEHEVKIKWPNDIYVEDQKIAGILVENSIQGNELKHSVAGMGINVNQQNFMLDKACSVAGLKGVEVDLLDATNKLIECLGIRYLQLEQSKFETLWLDYHQVLYKKDIPSSFTYKGETIMGTPVGIDESGRLRLDVNGEERYFQVKELIWN